MATTANCAAIRTESTTLTNKIKKGLIFVPHSVGGRPWLYSFRWWPLAALVIIAAACVAGSPRTVRAETIGSFSIEKIVDGNTPRPDGKGNFQNPLSPSPAFGRIGINGRDPLVAPQARVVAHPCTIGGIVLILRRRHLAPARLRAGSPGRGCGSPCCKALSRLHSSTRMQLRSASFAFAYVAGSRFCSDQRIKNSVQRGERRVASLQGPPGRPSGRVIAFTSGESTAKI